MKSNTYWEALTGHSRSSVHTEDSTITSESSTLLQQARKDLYIHKGDYYVWPLLMSAYSHPELLRGLPLEVSSLMVGCGSPYTGTIVEGAELIYDRTSPPLLNYVPDSIPAPTEWYIDVSKPKEAIVSNNAGYSEVHGVDIVLRDSKSEIYVNWGLLPFRGGFRSDSGVGTSITIKTQPLSYPYRHAREVAGQSSSIQQLLISSGYLSIFLAAKDDATAMAAVCCALIHNFQK